MVRNGTIPNGKAAVPCGMIRYGNAAARYGTVMLRCGNAGVRGCCWGTINYNSTEAAIKTIPFGTKSLDPVHFFNDQYSLIQFLINCNFNTTSNQSYKQLNRFPPAYHTIRNYRRIKSSNRNLKIIRGKCKEHISHYIQNSGTFVKIHVTKV